MVALFGPTAVGKTEIAIELAELLRARGEEPVAVSVDALQVYEGIDVLTAKPAPQELASLDHRLISFVPIDSEYSAGQFAERAHDAIDSLLAEGRTPIVVGGTGLYLRAALADLSFEPSEGDLGELWSADTRHPTVVVCIAVDREELYRRANERVEWMIGGGAVEEVRLALERGVSKTARKALGFAEIELYLAGEIGESEMTERIKRRTRNYARRQLTWMRKLPSNATIDRTAKDAETVASEIAGLSVSQGADRQRP